MRLLYSLSFLMLFCSTVPAQTKPSIYCGTYTSGNSTGIYRISTFHAPVLSDSFAASNPSFLAVSPGGNRLYAVHENSDSLNNGGSVSAYRISKGRRLQLLNTLPTGGNSPCYVSVHPDGRYVYVANYGGGSLAVFGIGKKGKLTGPIQVLEHSGNSIVAKRQSAPHVHAVVVSPDGDYLLAPDLGIDKIMIYRIDRQTGLLSPAPMPFMPIHAGAGPRHLAFHPSGKFLYLTEELSGTVGVFSYDRGTLKLMQSISTVPEGYAGQFSVADIHLSPDGRHLYASNRATANSIVIYSVDSTNGILSVVGYQDVLGIKPRNFILSPDGTQLWVANQQTDTIVVFNRDRNTGRLSDSGKRISVPSPVCLIWVK